MKIYKRHITSSEPIVVLPVTDNEAVVIGECLKLADGKLTKASGTDTVTHIAVSQVEAGTDKTAQVIEVQKDMEFLAQLSADGASLNVGDKVTIADDGVKVTATTDGGIATIKAFHDAETGVDAEVVVTL